MKHCLQLILVLVFFLITIKISSAQSLDGNNAFIQESLIGKTYYAELPCDFCAGLEQRLTFLPDGVVQFEELREGEDEIFPTTKVGQYIININKIYIYQIEGKANKQVYYIDAMDSFLLLDAYENPMKGPLAKKYVFHKVQDLKPYQIKGEYIDGNTKEGFYQRMQIKYLKEKEYRIKISYGNSTKGCNFEGIGRLAANRIEIPLNTYNKKMNSILTITFDEHSALLYVFPDDMKGRIDLTYFCDGGASLAGEFYDKLR